LVLLGLVLAGCGGAAPRPLQFTFAAGSEDPMVAVATALTGNGFEPASTDREGGVIATRWEDTGAPAGRLKGQAATIVRRFTATVTKGASSVQVALRIEAQRCAKDGFSIGRHAVHGACEALDGLPPPQQEELDRMGASLQQALAAAK
jgi:hypothetical protein